MVFRSYGLSERTPAAHPAEQAACKRAAEARIMKVDRWNTWLQIAATLGLIGGLILVAVQIQQTRELARVRLQIEGTLAFQQVEIAMLGENPAEAWARSIRDPESLSPADVKIVDSYLIHEHRAQAHSMHQGDFPSGSCEPAAIVELGDHAYEL